jgi:hypothetical protein
MTPDNALNADPHGICGKCGHSPHRGTACWGKVRVGPHAGEPCSCVRNLGPCCAVCGIEARILITETATDGTERMVCPEPISCMKRRFDLVPLTAESSP